MFDHKHYVPILKAKAGELLAIRDLTAATRKLFTPLFEIQLPTWDFEEKKLTKSIQDQLDRSAERIAKAWSGEGPTFIDTILLENDQLGNGDHPLEHILQVLDSLGVESISVVYLGSSAKAVACAAKHVAANHRGACLRLTIEDIDTDSLEADIKELLEALSIEPKDVDLLLDLEAFSPSEHARVLLSARVSLQSIPYLTDWRTLTLAGTSFPVNLSPFAADTENSIPRTELIVWDTLVRSNRIARKPAFSDYGIQHPELAELDPRIITMSASIRYAADDHWVIVRGRSVRKKGWAQYNSLSKKLAARSEFSGNTHCWGCNYVKDCAAGAVSHGNATTWRRVGTAHHVTLVAEQIANYPVP